MSVKVSSKVWKLSKLTGSEKLMLLAIADFADEDGRAYPSITTLASMCRITVRYAVKLLESLVASGELQVVKHAGAMGRGGRTNLYRIVFEPVADSPEVVNPGSVVPPGEVVHPSSVVNPSSVLNPGSGSSELGFREVVNQSSPKPSGNHQEPSEEREAAPHSANGKASRAKAKRHIPDDWQPDDALTAWFREKRPDLQLPLVVELFRNHYIGKGEARADWSASFRTWALRERRGAIVDGSHALDGGQSFAERDRAAGMARWEQMTGRPHPDRRGSGRLARPLHSGFEHLDYSPPKEFQ